MGKDTRKIILSPRRCAGNSQQSAIIFPVITAANRVEGDEYSALRWQRAVEYFRARGGVLFLSQNRFWEKHAFPQQSLAKYLTQAGVRVTWLDGYGWHPYQPVVRFNSPLLTVKPLFQPPGNRFSSVRSWSRSLQRATINRIRSDLGGRPVIWVQEGHHEELIGGLPYVDVYSVFDNPYLMDPHGTLCRRASLILCQNSYATRWFKAHHPSKTFLALPPLDLADDVFVDQKPIELPKGLPQKLLGAVGSLMIFDFDFDLLEIFLRQLPDWGFLLVGRTDPIGKLQIQRLRHYPNFHYLPWVPRHRVAAAWKALSATLLLYRSFRPQDGAFPTRALESLHFGVPCVATRIPKTADLDGIVPRTNNVAELVRLAVQAAQQDRSAIEVSYRELSMRMNPKEHLIRVAEFLNRP